MLSHIRLKPSSTSSAVPDFYENRSPHDVLLIRTADGSFDRDVHLRDRIWISRGRCSMCAGIAAGKNWRHNVLTFISHWARLFFIRATDALVYNAFLSAYFKFISKFRILASSFSSFSQLDGDASVQMHIVEGETISWWHKSGNDMWLVCTRCFYFGPAGDE